MVKQTKTFKKGNVTKKALSAILAASMVMTSSSFVMAAPVEVEDVAVEAAAVAEDAAVVDVVEDVEENVGVEVTQADVKVEDAVYTGTAITPRVTVVVNGETLVQGRDFTFTAANNIDVTDHATVKISFSTGSAYEGNAAIDKEFAIKPLVLNSGNAQLTIPVKGYVYNGTEQKPVDPTATSPVAGVGVDADKINDAIDASKTNFEFQPYSASYDLKSAGSQRVKLVDKKGNIVFDDSVGAYDYKIDQAEFTSDKFDSLTGLEFLYTGSPVAVKFDLKLAGKTEVVDPSTYTIQYYDKDNKVSSGPQTNVKTGYKFDIVSNGTGNYKAGVITGNTYDIVVGDFEQTVANATISGTVKKDGKYHLTYTGKEQSIVPSDIVIPGMTQGIDYTVDGSKVFKDADSTGQKITITGINKYDTKTAELTVVVDPMEINTTDFTITAVADGDTLADVLVTIKKGDLELVKDTDFSVENMNISKRTVDIKGVTNYTTKDNKAITVQYTKTAKKLIRLADISSILAKSWTGKQITPAVKVTVDSKELERNVDYTLSYGANVNTGVEAGTVTVTGIGKYEGTVTVKFDIEGTKIDKTGLNLTASAADVSLDAVKAGNGKSTPVITFDNGASAPSDLTFTTKYYMYDSANTTDHNKGAELSDAAFKTLVVADPDPEVVIEITGSGKYSGTIYTNYHVVNADNIANVATVSPIADQQYTGNAIEPAVVVTPKSGTLTKDVDYKVSYMYNTQVGTAYAVVTGIGAYAGEIVTSFKIVGEMPQEIVVLAAQERDLGNGTRTLNSKATKIKYTTAPETAVTYTSSDENVVTVDAEGNLKYTGLGEATITIEAKAENGYKAAKKEIKVVVKLAKPSFTPFSKNNAFTLTSSTVKGAEKFEVQYATKKNFSNAKTKTFTTTTAGKIRQVKVAAADKRTYYVRVRAVSGTTKSAWSGVKTVATK